MTDERRRWPRLPMELTVEYRSVEAEGGEEGTGTTENVSAGGVYFVGADTRGLDKGATLQLRLCGIERYTVGCTFHSLGGECTVVRVMPRGEDIGVAVEFNEVFKLQTLAENDS